MSVQVKNRQSLPDIALQEGGSMDAVVNLAIRNDVAISTTLEHETFLKKPVVSDQQTARLYALRKITPATDLTAEDLEAAPFGGIGYMGIEIDFIVS